MFKIKNSAIAEILGLSKAEVVKWCLGNSFELIEMMSEEEEEDDEEGMLIILLYLFFSLYYKQKINNTLLQYDRC